MERFSKTISRRLGTWEVMSCHNVIKGKMQLVKWGVKKWVAAPYRFIYYDTWDEVLDHINRNT